MANGVRGGALALFFVLGMAFMAAIFVLANPQWAEHERVRVVKEETPRKVALIPVARPVYLEKEDVADSAEEQGETAPKPAFPRKIETKKQPVAEPAPVEIAPELPKIEPARQSEMARPLAVAVPVSTSGRIGSGNTQTARVLSGRAVLMGTPPAELVIPKDPSCESVREGVMTTRHYRLGPKNGLADVVIEVQGFRKQPWPRPLEPHVLTYRQCFIEPYISAMQKGQKMVVENGDSIPHNMHALPEFGQERNMILLPKSRPLEIKLSREDDFVRFRCDIHAWESAYIAVFDHPFFAVTDAEGRFEIKGLPKGKYVVMASHRKADADGAASFEIGEQGAEVELRLRVPR